MIGISGASGFVGENLIRYFGNSRSIKTFSREELNRFSVSSLEGCGSFVHLAGKAHDLKNTSNPDSYFQINFELTKKVYDAFLKSETKVFIFISSVKAAADLVSGILTEEYQPNPKTVYGKSKLMAERYIQSQSLPDGKSYYILRPCMIHGPGNKGNLNLLYKFVSKGIPYPLASFCNNRSFLSVENLCFIIKRLIEKDSNVSSGVYNIADDEVLSTNDLVSLLAAALNRKALLWRISPSFVRGLAKIGDKFNFPLNTERLNKLTENYIVSNEKIKMALDIKMPLSARDGITITANAFRDE